MESSGSSAGRGSARCVWLLVSRFVLPVTSAFVARANAARGSAEVLEVYSELATFVGTRATA